MKKEIAWLLTEKYDGVPSPVFDADIKRLENGEPLDYVIGWTPFAGTRIYLDSHPLIPRPETEHWVLQAIDDIRALPTPDEFDNHHAVHVLDLCAGSGCIGIAVARAIPNSTIDFVEIEERHHSTIQRNIEKNGIDYQRTRIFSGNLFERTHDTYDAILTNPPYIDPHYTARIQKSVLDHEPHEALFGGEKGLQILAEICKQAPMYLKENGLLYIEHEPEQADFMQEHLPRSIQHTDQFGIVRYTTWQKQQA